MNAVVEPVYLHNKRRIIQWLLLLLCCSDASQGQQLNFNHLTVENGLSHNAVLAITQDSRGFMWFGTQIGLNRYDGHHFKIYKLNRDDSTSISDNNIIALLNDSQKNLWVATANGLNKYDTLTDAFHRIRINNKLPVAVSNSILCLLEDRYKNIWVGTANGLLRISGVKKSGYFPGKAIRTLYEDQSGFLWIGTNDGLLKIKAGSEPGHPEVYQFNPDDTGSISANYVTALSEDGKGNLWIGTQNGGLNKYLPATNKFFRIVPSRINASGTINTSIRKITPDKKGRLWIGTQEGLAIFDPATNEIQLYRNDAGDKKSLSQNSVYSLFEDASGSMWTGTYFGGINVVYPQTTLFNIIQKKENAAGLSNNVVSSIVEDDKQNLWLGTEGGGLNYFDRNNNRFTSFTTATKIRGIGSNLVKSVYRDRSGNIWAGTHGGGLNLFEPLTRTFKKLLFRDNNAASLNSEVLALLEDSEGRFWTGTNSGTKIFRRKDKELLPLENDQLEQQASGLFARCLFEDSRRQVWVGAVNGLFRVEKDRLVQVSRDYINCIREDRNGNIWTGIYYGGLAKFDARKDSLIYFTEKEGLPNTNIIGILDDDHNNLWLSTDNGLVKFNAAAKTFHTYTVSDGLSDNAFNYNSYLKDSNGDLIFGGYNGFISFSPKNIEINNFIAPVVFTNLSLFNEPVRPGGADQLLSMDMSATKTLSFKHDQDVFTIEFALLNFIKSNKNKYAYTLKGFDKGWNEITATSVTYTNLPAGDYTLMVKGANNDGLWSEPFSLEIKILPPFWFTWWAYCIYVLIGAGIFFFVTRFFFLQALIKKEDELHQVKLNFFTNVSHEIRTHLTLIMLPLEKIIDLNEINEFTRQQLLNVKTNTDRLLKLVSELMDFRKAETNHLQLQIGRYNLVTFLQGIYQQFRELSQEKNISTSFHYNVDTIPLYFDKEQLSKVFFNILSNAFKFTPAGGQVVLSISGSPKGVTISVEDNGRGIAPEHLEKLFANFFQVADHGVQNTGYGVGLALSRNIVELHKGSLTVQSKPAATDSEGRTNFIVSLLAGDKHFEGLGYPRVADNPETTAIQEATHAPMTDVDTDVNIDAAAKIFTILVVEDNDELRQMITEAFKKMYQVVECSHGVEGWRIATEQLPDLIISDVMMPEMDGFTFCAKLKTDERTSHIPVILLTAKSSQLDLVNGLETGADIYLTKPFNTKVLELNVRNLLALRERLRQKFSLLINDKGLFAQPVTSTGNLTETALNTVDSDFINQVIRLVQEHMEDPEFGVDMLARKVAMSQPVLYKKLKAVTNMSVNDFVKTLRLKRAAHLLKQQQFTVYEVAYAVGYNDRKYFSKEFKKQFGQTPSDYAGQQ